MEPVVEKIRLTNSRGTFIYNRIESVGDINRINIQTKAGKNGAFGD